MAVCVRRRYVDPAGRPGYARCQVNIRGKIVWVVLPLIIAPLVLTGVSSILTARESVTAVAAGLLQFKAEQLTTYAQGQWDLLVANGLETDPTYREASEAAVETFARSLLRSSTELIVALAGDGSIALRTGDVPEDESGRAPLASLAAGGASGWQTFSLAGIERVAYVNRFAPFDWTVFVTEASDTFYRSTERIVVQTGVILGASLLVSLLLLLLFAGRLTRPLRQIDRRHAGHHHHRRHVRARGDPLPRRDRQARPHVQPDDRRPREGVRPGEGVRAPRRGGEGERGEDPAHLPEVRAEGGDRPVLRQPREAARGRDASRGGAVLRHPQLHDHRGDVQSRASSWRC